MRGIAIVLALCACNQLYGLEHTKPDVDALARGCTAIGSDPVYSSYVTQASFIECDDYRVSPSRKLAVGVCSTETGPALLAGVPDKQLAPTPGILLVHIENGVMIRYQDPAFIDDERIALTEIRLPPASPSTKRAVVFRRGDDGVWTYEAELPFGAGRFDHVSAFFNGGTRSFVWTSSDMVEWALQDGVWKFGTKTTVGELGTMYLSSPTPSADGLRVMYTTATANGNRVFYTDRARVEDRFRVASSVPSIPSAFNVTMTADCERIYFLGLQSAFYSERL